MNRNENQMIIKALNMYGRVPEQYELLEEIERLKIIEEKYKDSQLYIHDFKEEIEKLNNIINELEKALDENVELTYVHNGKRQYNKTLTEGGLLFRDYIKSKLQELKGSDKE